jgi:hypothetical protein
VTEKDRERDVATHHKDSCLARQIGKPSRSPDFFSGLLEEGAVLLSGVLRAADALLFVKQRCAMR